MNKPRPLQLSALATRSAKAVFLTATLFLAACSSSVTTPPETATGLDANGGTWKTVVISSASQVTAPAPASQTSPAGIAELAAVKKLQNSTTADVIRYWDSSAVLRWNAVARQLVKAHKTDPIMASRTYALLSIAQYDASVSTWAAKYQFNRKTPYQVDNTIVTPTTPQNIPSYPSDHATIAGASAAVLSAIYPTERPMLDSLVAVHENSRIAGGYSFPSDITVGDSIGRVVAGLVMAKAAMDGSDMPTTVTIPTGDSVWRSSLTPAVGPLRPHWGEVKCWVITDMNAVAPMAPPAWKSAAYMTDLKEVRSISDNRTADQLAIAKKWSDDPGNTSTPPGHWNQIASDAMIGRGWSTLREAHAMAYTNMAMLDAGVCCWKTKYTYWLIRPSQVDTNIHVAVPLPNFPSYCSGHSSFSGSASRVLGYFMPDQASQFDAMAQEASLSRVYGGIHYRFDCTNALAMGQKVGDLATSLAHVDGSN